MQIHCISVVLFIITLRLTYFICAFKVHSVLNITLELISGSCTQFLLIENISSVIGVRCFGCQ